MKHIYHQQNIGWIELESNDDHALTGIELGVASAETQAETSLFLKSVEKSLREYFAGAQPDFSWIPLAPQGTLFQQAVWQVLQQIPYGETRSYQWVAQQIKNAKASRAVGQANGKNPIPIIIPCHRVINFNGSLGGYSGGLPIKRHLLDLESNLTVIRRSQ